jgi:surface protein
VTGQFNQPLNNWNTGKVVIFSGMFNNAIAFDQDINSWNTSSATKMDSMFGFAPVFNKPLNSWDTSKVTTISSMFQNAVKFNQPLNNWNTGAVTTTQNTFAGAKVFNQPIGNWDMRKVTTTQGMFERAEAFNQPVNTWTFTSVLYNLAYMFKNAFAFNQPVNNWDVGNVAFFMNMFEGATAFNSNVGWASTLKSIHFAAMFKGATSFNQPVPFIFSPVPVSRDRIFESMFEGAVAFNQSVNDWYVKDSSILKAMFKGATSYNSPMDKWETDNFADLASMFQGASAFVQDISSWCVKQFAIEPTDFATGCPIVAGNKPKWGKACLAKLLDGWYDPTVKSSLFKDYAGTQPVVNAGDDVRFMTDLSGNGNHLRIPVGTKAGIYRVGAGNPGYVEINGTRFIENKKIGAENILSVLPSIGTHPIPNNEAGSTIVGPKNVVSGRVWYVGPTAIPKVGLATADTQAVNDWLISKNAFYSAGLISDLSRYFAGEPYNLPIGNWNTSSVGSMAEMFLNTSAFNQDISTWDVSKVTNFQSMFEGAAAFNQPLEFGILVRPLTCRVCLTALKFLTLTLMRGT